MTDFKNNNINNFQNALIYFLAFSSGFCIMGIELLGGRILAPFFGSSVHIWGSIITVFMLSLSLGYLLGGKLSTRNAGLTRYGSIFLTAGIMVLPIALWAPDIMETIFISIEDSRYGSLVASMAWFRTRFGSSCASAATRHDSACGTPTGSAWMTTV